MKMNVDNRLFVNSVLLIFEKRVKADLIAKILSTIGCKTIISMSIYDSLKILIREMPHMVICDFEMPDGTALSLYDRLQAHPVLDKTPILVCTSHKTKEVLNNISVRNFAGVLFGGIKPKSFLRKSLEVLRGNVGASPYFYELADRGISTQFDLILSAEVLGKTKYHLVVKSKFKSLARTNLLCVVDKEEGLPICLEQGPSIKTEGGFLHFLPLNKIRGDENGTLDHDRYLSNANGKKVVVLFFDPNEDAFLQLSKIVVKFDIQLEHAKTSKDFETKFGKLISQIDLVLFNQFDHEIFETKLENILEKIPLEKRPNIIAALETIPPKFPRFIHFIKKPYGIGELVQNIFGYSWKPVDISDLISKYADDSLELNFISSFFLIGVDEIGGVIEGNIPLLEGSQLTIDHRVFEGVEFGKHVLIEKVVKLKNKPNTWQMKFRFPQENVSKVIHLEKIMSLIES